MATSNAERILLTPSAFCKEHFLYVQEVGTLKSLEPHKSSRENLESFLFFIVLEGTGSFQYASTTYSLESGDCVFIDCHTAYSHESNAQFPWKLMWVHFYGSMVSAFYKEYSRLFSSPVFHTDNPLPFTKCLDSIYQESLNKGALYELNNNCYLTNLITLCFSQNPPEITEDESIQVKLHHIHNYIDAHFTEKITLDSLADDFYISKFHLAREYKKIFGITLGNEITNKRIEKAKSLLRYSNASIETISLVCGFSMPGYFIKVFKKEEGITPSDYRKKW